MIANDKIHVAKYLKDLNERAEFACSYHYCKREYITPLPFTCKRLAENCQVTTATITNLTTNSKFYLLHKIAEEILNAYYGYFVYEEARERRENPDELIHPRDINYVLMCLTNYYTDEFLNY